MRKNDDHYRLIGIYLLCVAALVMFLMCSCATKRSTESSIEMHRMSVMTERMDSLLHATSTWQKSLYEKQSSLVDSFKQSEVRDTSRIIFLGEKGDTVKEKIVIREIVEREHSSSESTQELREEFFRQTDSLLQVNRSMEAKMDSLLRDHNKETVVEKKPGLMKMLKWVALGILVAVIGFFAVSSAFIKKR